MGATCKICVSCQRECAEAQRSCDNCGSSSFSKSVARTSFALSSVESFCLALGTVGSGLAVVAVLLFGILSLQKSPWAGILILVFGVPFCIGWFVVFRAVGHYVQSLKAGPGDR